MKSKPTSGFRLAVVLCFFLLAVVITSSSGSALLLVLAQQEEESTGKAGGGNGNDDEASCAVNAAAAETKEDPTTRSSSSSSSSSSRRVARSWAIGGLTPRDLPGIQLFENFTSIAQDYSIDERFVTVQQGTVPQQKTLVADAAAAASSNGSITPPDAILYRVLGALPLDTVQAVRNLLERYNDNKNGDDESAIWDVEPDTVDALPTYEIFMDTPELQLQQQQQQQETLLSSASSSSSAASSSLARDTLRRQFHELTRHFVEEILTPMVRNLYPDVCNKNKEDHLLCQPCYSLIRRYRHGERQSHATHQDGHALVTVVISLSQYDRDYRGGLYVSNGSGGGSSRQYLALNQGDAIVHQPYLYHGVQVWDVNHLDKKEKEQTQRWSWILWYQDSTHCNQDWGHEWFAQCAAQGDPICQYLHSTKDINVDGGVVETPQEQNQRILQLTRQAADAGVGEAAVKMARAYLQLLPSPLTYNATLAQLYYAKGIASHHPDAHYGMAQLVLLKWQQHQRSSSDKAPNNKEVLVLRKVLRKVIYHLEEAAWLGSTFAMFNLGIVHAFGYGDVEINPQLSHEWFIQSGLPEGIFMASQQAKAGVVKDDPDTVGAKQQHVLLLERARKLGWGAPWRKHAREQTGSGGSGGVDLNLPWPVAPHGGKPPRV